MGRKNDFEFIIIGSGPAGLAAATELAKAKKRVALVEGRFFGGTNLNTRDIPYDVTLNFSHTYSKLINLPDFKNQDISCNLPNVAAHQLQTIINLSNIEKKTLKDSGIVYLEGYANFLDKRTIAIGNKQFTADKFILATGARLKILEIAGTDSVNFLTPETAIKIRRRPKAALIVGGGPTGCEIAEYYAELGIKVLIMETAERLLPKEDKEVGETMTEYFTKNLGIMVLPNCKVVALEQSGTDKHVIFRNSRSEKMVRVDCVILATGSQPFLDYGLENAGVKYKNTGIIVDKLFNTSTKNIYAIGDCIGGDSSTTLANYEGTVLAHNLITKSKTVVNYKGFVRSISTYPEVATIGFNEDDLVKRDRKYKKAIVNINEIVASETKGPKIGFIKLLSDRNNHILGATMVMPHAELLAGEIALAIRHNLSALELASTPHSINNYNYIIKLAAKKLLDKKK